MAPKRLLLQMKVDHEVKGKAQSLGRKVARELAAWLWHCPFPMEVSPVGG